MSALIAHDAALADVDCHRRTIANVCSLVQAPGSSVRPMTFVTPDRRPVIGCGRGFGSSGTEPGTDFRRRERHRNGRQSDRATATGFVTFRDVTELAGRAAALEARRRTESAAGPSVSPERKHPACTLPMCGALSVGAVTALLSPQILRVRDEIGNYYAKSVRKGPYRPHVRGGQSGLQPRNRGSSNSGPAGKVFLGQKFA